MLKCILLYVKIYVSRRKEVRLMKKIPVRSYSSEELTAIVKADGWMYIYTRGDHDYFKHPTKPGKLTIRRNQKNLPKFEVGVTLKLAGLR